MIKALVSVVRRMKLRVVKLRVVKEWSKSGFGCVLVEDICTLLSWGARGLSDMAPRRVEPIALTRMLASKADTHARWEGLVGCEYESVILGCEYDPVIISQSHSVMILTQEL